MIYCIKEVLGVQHSDSDYFPLGVQHSDSDFFHYGLLQTVMSIVPYTVQ